MTLGELGRMPLREFRLWAALYDLDPWGEEREDLRAGIIAAVVANCLTTGKSFKPSDFVPTFGKVPEPPPKSMDELKRLVLKCNGMLGGTVTTR